MAQKLHPGVSKGRACSVPSSESSFESHFSPDSIAPFRTNPTYQESAPRSHVFQAQEANIYPKTESGDLSIEFENPTQQYPKYKYSMLKKYNAVNYLQKTKITASKVKTSVDLYKNYNFTDHGHHAGCFFPTPCRGEKARKLENLFEGNKIQIYTEKNDDLNLVFEYAGGKKHTWGPNDITGFIFGGYGSRFWVLKNYINNMEPNEIKPSMLSWNMISLKITHRDKYYDLIVENEEEMDILIQFLL